MKVLIKDNYIDIDEILRISNPVYTPSSHIGCVSESYSFVIYFKNNTNITIEGRENYNPLTPSQRRDIDDKHKKLLELWNKTKEEIIEL